MIKTVLRNIAGSTYFALCIVAIIVAIKTVIKHAG